MSRDDVRAVLAAQVPYPHGMVCRPCCHLISKRAEVQSKYLFNMPLQHEDTLARTQVPSPHHIDQVRSVAATASICVGQSGAAHHMRAMQSRPLVASSEPSTWQAAVYTPLEWPS